MSNAAPGRPRHRSCAAVPLVVVVTVAGGCGPADPPAQTRPATAAAVDACLHAGAEHLAFPLDDARTVAVSVERDAQGWWSVRTTVDVAGETSELTCTAVPDEEHGARAASWSVTGTG